MAEFELLYNNFSSKEGLIQLSPLVIVEFYILFLASSLPT